MSDVRGALLRLLAPVLGRAGSAYLAGPDRHAVLDVARRLMEIGDDVTLGYWPAGAERPDAVLAEDVAALRALGPWGPRAALAVKAPALDTDPAAVRRLGREARATGVGLAFDSHSPREADTTLAMAAEARAEGARTAVALSTRWARTLQDVEIVAETGLSARLVKGQWPDEGPGRAAHGEAALRAAFFAVLDRLIAADVPVSVATHDTVLLDAALARLVAAGVEPQAELLLGLPVGRARAVAARHRARVRYYLAFGHPSLAYPLTAVVRRPRLAVTLGQGLLLGAGNQRVQQRAALLAPDRAPGRTDADALSGAQ